MASDERETKTSVHHHGTTAVEKTRDDEFLLLLPGGEIAICEGHRAANKAIKRYWHSHFRPGFICAGRAVWRDLCKMIQ